MSSRTDKEFTPTGVSRQMMKHDRTSQWLGIKLERIDSGCATMSMTITADMLNGHGICHGGMIFTLADTAFAYACNSRNIKTVALACSINFVASAGEGDLLTASAKEISLTGRTGIYDITVTNQSGTMVAHFRGTSYGTSSHVIDHNDG